MKLKIYALRNVKGDFFTKPITDPMEPEDMNKSNVRYCIVEKEKAKAAHMDESALYLIGYFDDTRGKIDVLEEPEFIEDYAKYFVNGN